jgi:hypothetical protein
MINASFYAYRVRVARIVEGARREDWNGYLEVFADGYTELHDWYYKGLRPIPSGTGYRLSNPDHQARWDARRELLEILAEEELVELLPIGPEDSEYFATEKLWAVIKAGERERARP